MARLPANEGTRNDGGGEIAGFTRAAVGERSQITMRQEMVAYDSLPPRIRQVLDDSQWRWSAYTTAQRLAMYTRQAGPGFTATGAMSPGDRARAMIYKRAAEDNDPISRIVREIEAADVKVLQQLYRDKDFADHPPVRFGAMRPHTKRVGKTRRRVR